MEAIAITDHDNVSCAVRFAKAATAKEMKPIQGAEVTLQNGFHLVLLAENPEGYANLCRILTKAHMSSPRGRPALNIQELRPEDFRGLFGLSGCRRGEIPGLILQAKTAEALEAARRYAGLLGRDRFFLELEGTFLPYTAQLNKSLWELAQKCRLGTVISCNVHYSRREDFPVHDILTCVRTLTKVHEFHKERKLNWENYLKPAEEICSVLAYCGIPADSVLGGVAEIVDACKPAISLGTKRHPKFPLPPGVNAKDFLREIVFAGARERYGPLGRKVARRIDDELSIISRLGFEDYFLIAWDLVEYARKRGIRHSGRGSAADSVVAYCLGITEVDAYSRGLLFARFLSLERGEAPDIDVDFDARYRDEVASYVESKYGSERVAAVCTFNTFAARSAIRDLGKALDLPEGEIDLIAKRMPYVPADSISDCIQRFPELRDSPVDVRKYRLLLKLCEKVAGFPRHMGTHLGGLVIGEGPLTEIMPLQRAAKGVVVGQFDKDDVEDLGMVKIDLLSLRMLSAVDTAVASIRKVSPTFRYDSIPLDDPATYKMIRQGDTVGAFQLESPAQRNLHVRLGARNIEDVIASVALIRPGPIKGNMVEPFIARRKGREPVTYLHPKLEPILKKTYGVVLFQEQVIEIATSVAGFTPGEADRLRRVMTHGRSFREMEAIGEEFVRKAMKNGIPEEVSRAVFSCIAGYASYGFCEAHAASFGVTAYKTAYLLRHFPAHFYAALLSHQPMGYYSPAIIVLEARRKGIAVLPPDVNRSDLYFRVESHEGGESIRTSLVQVKGVGEKGARQILKAREDGEFRDVEDFMNRASLDRDAVSNLVLCGAFDALCPNRRKLLWELHGARGGNPPDFSSIEKVCAERNILGFSVSGHIMEELRKALHIDGEHTTADLKKLKNGTTVRVSGIPFRPHRPPTRSGKTIVFFTLEDEFGLVDVTVFQETYQKYGSLLFRESVIPLRVVGTLQKKGNGTAIIASEIRALTLSGGAGKA